MAPKWPKMTQTLTFWYLESPSDPARCFLDPILHLETEKTGERVERGLQLREGVRALLVALAAPRARDRRLARRRARRVGGRAPR